MADLLRDLVETEEGRGMLLMLGVILLAFARCLGWTRHVPGLEDLLWPACDCPRCCRNRESDP
jgi:hypothetical protein